MLKYLQRYKNQYEDELNFDLMNKSADDPLVTYIEDSIRSLEIAPPIKIMKFEYTEDESKIDINRYIFKREKRARQKDKVDYKMISDNRCGSLSVWIQITLPVKDPKTKQVQIHQKMVKKSILVPLQDDDGSYYVKGRKYTLIYQLVEKSTYTGNQTVTLKSLMPIKIKRESELSDGWTTKYNFMDVVTSNDGGVMKKVEVGKEDVDSKMYKLPVYNLFMFNKEVPVILFYLANGVEWALDFLGVGNIMSFEPNTDSRQEGEIWFPISSKCFIRVKDKELFTKYTYIQGIVGSILSITSNRFTPDQVYDTDIWIKKLGNGNHTKGFDMLTFFNRLLDETTKKILRLDSYHKRDVYHLIRWMLMNFNELRLKDNMNLYNKRIRCNEYISALLTMEFSKRLNRVIAMGSKATIDNYKEIFKFPGDILLQAMHTSGILRFDDNLNDMDFFSKFKVTFKGPHALGNKNDKRVSIKARGIHPSYMKNFDVLVCGNSDPGRSALLSPWCDIDGFYFDHSTETDNFLYEFHNDMERKEKESGKNNDVIQVNSKDKKRYFEVLNKLADINSDIKVFGISNEDNVVVEDFEDIDAKRLAASNPAQKKEKEKAST